jgi:ABC-type glycerol-3-phosphate transport system permease component
MIQTAEPNKTLTPAARKRRLQFLALIIAELAVLVLLGFRYIQVEHVVDRVEVIGNEEITHFRNEIKADPLLIGFVLAGTFLPLASRRLRREPALMLAVQVTVVGLILFSLWPIAQVFVESFRAGRDSTDLSLVQFERLLQIPTVARATRNTLALGVTTAVLATTIGTLIAYTITLTDIPFKRWLTILTIVPLVSPPFAVSFAFILLFGRRGVITYDLLNITTADP